MWVCVCVCVCVCVPRDLKTMHLCVCVCAAQSQDNASVCVRVCVCVRVRELRVLARSHRAPEHVQSGPYGAVVVDSLYICVCVCVCVLGKHTHTHTHTHTHQVFRSECRSFAKPRPLAVGAKGKAGTFHAESASLGFSSQPQSVGGEV